MASPFSVRPRAGAGALSLALSLALGCAASAPPPEPKPVAPPAAVAEPATTPVEPPPAEPAEAEAAEPGGSSEPAAAVEVDDSHTPRQIRYVVTPEGMRVRVDGVELVPRAELVQKAGGAIAIKVRVEARSEDGKKHSLLAPAGKELAFAGKIRRQDGAEERFDDERSGERELVLDEGKDAVLTRTFPDPKGAVKPLKDGDELELAVGLWGLGDDASTRRAVRGVCKITLSYPRKKPKLKLTPPDGLSK
jgi:hypothetical protein